MIRVKAVGSIGLGRPRAKGETIRCLKIKFAARGQQRSKAASHDHCSRTPIAPNAGNERHRCALGAKRLTETERERIARAEDIGASQAERKARGIDRANLAD